jgi:hypothetical protein
MFLYDGAMDATFERLFHRVSGALAIITACYHCSDKETLSHWRQLAHYCVPHISESIPGDSYSFARSMWQMYLQQDHQCIGTWCEDSIRAAYTEVFHAICEMFGVVSASNPTSFGSTQEKLDLLVIIDGIDARMRIVSARMIQRQELLARAMLVAGRGLHASKCAGSAAAVDGEAFVRHRIPFV